MKINSRTIWSQSYLNYTVAIHYPADPTQPNQCILTITNNEKFGKLLIQLSTPEVGKLIGKLIIHDIKRSLRQDHAIKILQQLEDEGY